MPGLPSDGATGARPPDDRPPDHGLAGADGGHRFDDPDPELGADGACRYDDLDPGEDGYDPDPADLDFDEDAEHASWLAGLPADVRAEYEAGPWTGRGESMPAGVLPRGPGRGGAR